MKRIVGFLSLMFCVIPGVAARSSSCPNPETIQRLQELQRCIDTIKSKVTDIQINIDNIDVDVSGIDDLEVQISILGEVLCSKIENISVIVDLHVSGVDLHVSGIEDLENLISTNDQILCSKIEDLSEMVSTNDDLILSAIDNIEVTATCSGIDGLISASDVFLCSKLDDQASASDALVCSKVGDLDDFGSCLDAVITVPDDIDNLNLNTIELLKTILLELRGCNQG